MSAEVELIVETPQGVEVHVKAPWGKAFKRTTLTYSALPSREALMSDVAKWLKSLKLEEGEKLKDMLKDTRVEEEEVEKIE